jgi:hypothetical protein
MTIIDDTKLKLQEDASKGEYFKKDQSIYPLTWARKVQGTGI